MPNCKTIAICNQKGGVLNKSPYVIAAEPDYHQYVDDDIEEIVTDQPTQPTSSETEAPSIGLAKGDADGDGFCKSRRII